VVVALWTGEEAGRLGSGHHARHPAWPLERTAAYVNLDMLGYPWTAELLRSTAGADGVPEVERFLAALDPADVVELGLPPGRPELEEAVRRGAAALGLVLRLEWTSGVDGGSDYRAFARAGVPFLRFFDVFHANYHRPSDTADALDVTQVRKLARLALAAVWLLADA
jgi:Zn-dependent M28 family amino/carboxypeptidase